MIIIAIPINQKREKKNYPIKFLEGINLQMVIYGTGVYFLSYHWKAYQQD